MGGEEVAIQSDILAETTLNSSDVYPKQITNRSSHSPPIPSPLQCHRFLMRHVDFLQAQVLLVYQPMSLLASPAPALGKMRLCPPLPSLRPLPSIPTPLSGTVSNVSAHPCPLPRLSLSLAAAWPPPSAGTGRCHRPPHPVLFTRNYKSMAVGYVHRPLSPLHPILTPLPSLPTVANMHAVSLLYGTPCPPLLPKSDTAHLCALPLPRPVSLPGLCSCNRLSGRLTLVCCTQGLHPF